MKVSILGAGSYGTTLGQVLIDNGHEVLLYDNNKENVDKINNLHLQPYLDKPLPISLKASNVLEDVMNFSENILITLPTKVIRSVLKEINTFISEKKLFINGSKGIEPNTLNRISEIVYQEIDNKYIKGFVCLTGPGHAEEIIERKLTCLASASESKEDSVFVQHLFSNSNYMRVYSLEDLTGAEINGSIKNAIAVVSGVAFGYGLLENARAALITRGCLEMEKISVALGSKKETVFGLTGLGDLIVTCSSFNSRNFRAGKLIGEGKTVKEVIEESKMTVEGIRAIEACYQVGKKFNLELPIIQIAYDVCYNNMKVDVAISSLLNRTLKEE